ncbi:hypothetical protein NKW84_12050 [Acetobacter senegalensis]|uniref:hypothetical protein n=1 Tax=Acetobacter senegalensis TaxID=446692 RepID=UPI00209FBE29|nr:hypothetical protein [Acetobacter senegalensis]MCP1196586.1 hypothetical protein [Acetobacter senegalensis]
MSKASPFRQEHIIVTDGLALCRLAKANALDRLHQIGRRVLVPDMAIAGITKQVAEWLACGRRKDSPAPVRICPTKVGRAYRALSKVHPKARWPDAVGLAIVEWLPKQFRSLREPSMIIYENSKARAICRYSPTVHATCETDLFLRATATPEDSSALLKQARAIAEASRQEPSFADATPAWDSDRWRAALVVNTLPHPSDSSDDELNEELLDALSDLLQERPPSSLH